MCAINGFNFKDEQLLKRMNEITAHRGPDETGCFFDDHMSLGHNRLSIIDLSPAAKQPMSGLAGRFQIVYNGEIYNYLELKRELERDYQFVSRSDTEVILAAYARWGEDCVQRFNGMFAFAIWDTDKHELFVARDHIGIKPFYYFWDDSHFIFSSEIKAILEHALVPRVVNLEALNHYLRLLYVPEPLTMFEGIFKLPPATIGKLSNRTFSTQSYWMRDTTVDFQTDRRLWRQTVRDTIQKAVERQLVSDRPLGIYLSGGIDSSVVLDCLARVRGSISTFSVGFDLRDDEQSEKFNSDFNLARRTARHYGTRHHEILLAPRDVVELFEKAVWHMDEPISKPNAVAMMKIAAFTKPHVAVVLGGDGGDELFGGYDRYRMSLAADYYQQHLPSFVRRLGNRQASLAKLNSAPGAGRYALFMFQKDDILERVVEFPFRRYSTAALFKEKYFNDPLPRFFVEAQMETDRRSWLPDDSLVLTDKMTMSAGLEARVPLLDREVVEFAARIPRKYKVTLRDTKIILKEAFKERLPAYLFNQPKRGWYAPGAKWIRRPEITEMAQSLLSPNYYESTSTLFRWDEIQRMLEEHCAKEQYHITMLWALMTFQAWARIFKVKLP